MLDKVELVLVLIKAQLVMVRDRLEMVKVQQVITKVAEMTPALMRTHHNKHSSEQSWQP